MVVKNIEDHAGIMMEIPMQPFGSQPEQRMRIGKGVDLAVQQDAVSNFVGVFFIRLSANAVGHKVPDPDQLVFAREVYVCKKIHVL